MSCTGAAPALLDSGGSHRLWSEAYLDCSKVQTLNLPALSHVTLM